MLYTSLQQSYISILQVFFYIFIVLSNNLRMTCTLCWKYLSLPTSRINQKSKKRFTFGIAVVLQSIMYTESHSVMYTECHGVSWAQRYWYMKSSKNIGIVKLKAVFSSTEELLMVLHHSFLVVLLFCQIRRFTYKILHSDYKPYSLLDTNSKACEFNVNQLQLRWYWQYFQ